VIDEPQKSIYASEAAAPAFRNTMRASLLRERVPPLASANDNTKAIQLANRMALERLSGEKFSATSKSLGGKLELNEKSQLKVPDLRGLTLREVMRVLGPQQLDIEIEGTGLLDEQVPAPGHWLDRGSKVKLIFRDSR
jgi:cell division protein FtsI (penicillin-binding protein 3)